MGAFVVHVSLAGSYISTAPVTMELLASCPPTTYICPLITPTAKLPRAVGIAALLVQVPCASAGPGARNNNPAAKNKQFNRRVLLRFMAPPHVLGNAGELVFPLRK